MKHPYSLLILFICIFSTGVTAQCVAPSLGNTVIEDQRAATLLPTRADNVTGYRVVLTDDVEFTDPTINPDTSYLFGPNEPIILYGLDTAENYRVNIQAICGAEVSPFSNRLIFTTEGGDRPLLDDRDGLFNYFPSARTICVGQPGSTFAGTNQGDPAGPCGGDPDDDVWYSFSPIWPKYTFTVDPIFGTDTALVFEIYDERQDTLVACTSGLPGETVSITLENIPVDRSSFSRFEYDMRVYTVGTGGYAAFEICAAGEILPVADETGCVAAELVNLDGTGAENEFIDVVNADGEVIVSIENTQPLGEVDVRYYEDPNGARVFGPTSIPYLGRNISISPTTQPAGPVRVRSYLTRAAVDSFIAANGIASVADLRVTKVATGNCSEDYAGNGVSATFEDAGRYGGGYYIDVLVNEFSEFFFDTDAQPLGSPVSIRENGREISWGIAPNPVHDQVTLTTPASLLGETIEVELYDLLGHRFLQRKFAPAERHQLAVGDLPRGMYVGVIRAGGVSVSVRIIKK
ncbi:T9SS type A sorting domain-containing protein [Neolewinella antarctica]|uniref:Secretion system C-terminal sorting domain-containing protein n=1 Tax=Neolewinella antarctica TaxID=442734 RepID=A0ABX0XHQ3_9BACT|nr:T9SS type A sorting domain-containing protein [Neolewinella antarctica]NJC28414.1 hypothetical protein [Neolewinella antarctica]